MSNEKNDKNNKNGKNGKNSKNGRNGRNGRNGKNGKKSAIMEHPFSKSISSTEKCKRLLDLVTLEDTVAVLINADPDSMASALALKRIFWRKVKKTLIFHVNTIKRADNLALIKSPIKKPPTLKHQKQKW